MERRIFWVDDEFCRFECKCGYYVDIHKKCLKFDRKHFDGIRCPGCGNTVVRW